jgi:FG-GAP repeat
MLGCGWCGVAILVGVVLGVVKPLSAQIRSAAKMLSEGNGRQTATAATSASGEILNESAQLLASDGEAFDQFGRSVSLSGDTALLGAWGDDDNGDRSGSAYVFRWDGSTWVEEQKLLASGGAENDSFGHYVSNSGSVAVVSASCDDDNGNNFGCAYVFRWDGSTWVEEQKLVASDGAAGDGFGLSASVSGDVAIVGAMGDSNYGYPFDSGSAYIYRWDGLRWMEEQKLLTLDIGVRGRFGVSVSVFGSVAVVGAFFDDENGARSGSAYVFRWDGLVWTEEQKLLASDGAAHDQFGFSVSVSGNVAVVGARYDDNENGESSGSAYVFRWDGSTWVEEQKLLPSGAAAWDFFGESVSVSSDVAVVGARIGDGNVLDSGSAHVFRWNGSVWIEEQKLVASSGADTDHFGSSVSVSGETVLVGAFFDDDNGTDSGSAYVFEIGITDCDENGIDDAEDIANCVGDLACGDCNRNGIPDGCEVGPGVAGFNLSFDYLAFSWCMEGPVSVSIDACCVSFDVEVNDSVALDDFANFQRMFVGD